MNPPPLLAESLVMLGMPPLRTRSTLPHGRHDAPHDRAAEILANARRILVVTGAGMSEPSGIPTFRGPGGMYGEGDQITAPLFAKDLDDRPDAVFSFVQKIRDFDAQAEPHGGHRALAQTQRRLRQCGGDLTIVTMNIDTLHERAGAQAHHLHGAGQLDRCRNECRVCLPASQTPAECPECGGPTRPDVVLYGESMDLDAEWAGKRKLREADAFVVVGSSGATTQVGRWAIHARRDYGVPSILLSKNPPPEFADLFDVIVDESATQLEDILFPSH